MKKLLVYGLLTTTLTLSLPLEQGGPIWLDRYNGTANGYDDAGAIATDVHGNIYVGGISPAADGMSSFAVLKYKPNGSRAFVARATGVAGKATTITVDPAGNVFAAGYRYVNPFVQPVLVSFAADGKTRWSRRIDGTAVKLIALSNGNLLVASNFSDGYDRDWSTALYSPKGERIWEVRYDDPQGRNDTIANARLDRSGNIVVAGTVGTSNELNPGDVSVAKYSPTGQVLWQSFFTVGSATHEFVDDFGIDADGNIYVFGGTAENASIYVQASDLWLKYSVNGALVGTRTGEPCPNDDVGTAEVDGKGNLYSVTFSRVVKYSPTGDLVWRKEITDPSFGLRIPRLTLNSVGDIIIAGTSQGSSYQGDYLVYAFDRDGGLRWNSRYDGPAHGDDTVEGVTVDGEDNVFVTGTSWNGYTSVGGTADDILTLKLAQ